MTAEAPQSQRAAQVCRNCKQRKKACDMVLPICGHCSKRDLECRYEDANSTAQRNLVLVGTVADCLASRPGPALDGNMNFQYFRNFHSWLPVVSPATLQKMATRYEHDVAPADFSVLLLCMYLVVLQPVGELATSSPLQPRDLHNSVKLFFGHCQTHLCSSLNLAQACILIASYEYACGKIREAYITIGHAVRLGHILQLQHSIRTDSFRQGLHFSHSLAEQRNLWWGIIVMERLIVLEMPLRGMPLASRYPVEGFQYSEDLDLGEELPSSQMAENDARTRKDDFAHVARACSYLDAVLMAIEEPALSKALLELGTEIVKFMRATMQLNTHAPHSDTLTIAIRSLMLRHEVLMNKLPKSEVEQRQQTEEALSSAAFMILEAAADHHQHFENADALSLSCHYCLDIAIQRYESRRALQQNAQLAQGVEAARRLMQSFRERWP